jgi:hypothetical protein
LTIAFLEIGQNNLQDELLLTLFIELDDNMFLGAGNDGSQPELRMFDLGALIEGRFKGHAWGYPLNISITDSMSPIESCRKP